MSMLKVCDVVLIGQAGDRIVSGLSFKGGWNDDIFISAPQGVRKQLFYMLTGARRPDSGTVSVMGEDLYGRPAEIVRKSLGIMPEDAAFIEEMPVIDGVTLPLIAAGLDKKQAAEKVREAAETVGVTDALYSRPRFLKAVQLKACAVIRAMVKAPDILIFEDFTGGLSLRDRSFLWDAVRNLRPHGSLLVYLSGDKEVPDEMKTAAVIDLS